MRRCMLRGQDRRSSVGAIHRQRRVGSRSGGSRVRRRRTRAHHGPGRWCDTHRQRYRAWHRQRRVRTVRQWPSLGFPRRARDLHGCQAVWRRPFCRWLACAHASARRLSAVARSPRLPHPVVSPGKAGASTVSRSRQETGLGDAVSERGDLVHVVIHGATAIRPGCHW
jgi:hypothetical protein